MTDILTQTNVGCEIWIALDMADFEAALELVRKTSPFVSGYKVHGSIEDDAKKKIDLLRKAGAKKIWWDRKIDDTPGTVKIVSANVKACGADRMTIMASSGIEAMMTAVKHGPGEIVAVTDLTSLSKAEIGMSRGMPSESSVLQKAQWAKLAGVGFIVCSVEEVAVLHKRRTSSKLAGGNLELYGIKLVVPGSRTITSELKGQVRSNTAMATLEAGADELVIGSEVWEAEDPFAALQQLYATMLASKQ